MDQLRAPVQHRAAQADAGDGLAEEHEAVGVVAPVAAAGVGVGIALAGEVFRGLHQVGGHLAVRQAPAQDARRAPHEGQAHVTQGAQFAQLAQGLRVGGDDQAGVVTDLAQGGGQGPSHVGEAAGLDQGMGLAAREEDTAAIGGELGVDGEALP